MQNQRLPLPLPNLPKLLPEETLYSWCGRVHLWNVNTSVLETSRILFGAPYSALLHDFPAHINQLQENTFHLIDTPSKELALTRTLLGYYLPFIDKVTAHDLTERVCQESYRYLKYKLGIPASRIGADHPLKYCQACAIEDIEEQGKAYWHIQHQFPSSLVCVKHQTPLHYFKPDITPVHQRKWLFPEKGELPQVIPVNDNQIAKLKKLALFSESLARVSPGTFNPQALAWTYQGQIKKMDMLTHRGSIRIKSFCPAVSQYYSGFDLLPGFHILEPVSKPMGGFAASLSRNRPRRGHPFKHLLLISLLFESWDEFFCQYRRASEKEPQWLSQPEQETDDHQDPRLDQFLKHLKNKGCSIRSAAEQTGISVTTGTQWAKLHGVKFKSRTKTLHPELLNQVRTSLRKGDLKKEIVASNKISLVSLNRLLTSEPDLLERWKSARLKLDRKRYRQSFLSVIKANPGLAVKHIRKIPGNGYQWLYQHDRQWLKENIPSLWNQNRLL